jgi:hypothetical protein
LVIFYQSFLCGAIPLISPVFSKPSCTDNDKESNTDDVLLLETADAKKKTPLCPMSIENKYYSLISVISKMGIRELSGGLCDYIKSIDCPKP